jgi:2-furoyl-CoA dehydrogenase FAD binding subunit
VAERPVVRAMPLPGSSSLDDALDEFAWSLEARDDLHASARYRRELVRRIGKSTLEKAVRCRA